MADLFGAKTVTLEDEDENDDFGDFATFDSTQQPTPDLSRSKTEFNVVPNLLDLN